MGILDNIQSPEDLKSLPVEALIPLAAEIREVIIRTVAKNGGHLASNLGIVELTLALHRVFSFPEDAIVFDVGHQAYAHKLLTGRREAFSTLRQGGGLSGFTNREESPYDVMTAGHSGSALSYAIGIAEANRLADNGRFAVAVIGDGSFTNGMVYEALNNAVTHSLRLIIVLNDNEMSISQNVGALSDYFSAIRTSKTYFHFKMVAKRAFAAVPVVGQGMIRLARRVRDFMKRILINQNMFEGLGLHYYGPVAGDNLNHLIAVFAEARSRAEESGAVVVHVNTKKGRGYGPAERFPDRFHSTPPFAVEDGWSADSSAADGQMSNGQAADRTFSEVFSDVLVYEAAKDDRICAVTAAMADGTGLSAFRKWYPERFFDVGIAEEHAVTFAGGLSHQGFKPVVAIYSTFMQRAFDQVWHDAALQGANVLFVLSHAGLVPGDGVTHQGIYDVSLFAPVPGVTIDSPDSLEGLRLSVEEALRRGGPSMVRFPRGSAARYDRTGFVPLAEGAAYGKVFGKGAERVDREESADPSQRQKGGEPEQGPFLLAVTYGCVSEEVVAAASEAVEKMAGVSVAVVVLRRILPLPIQALDPWIRRAGDVVFVEEGIRTGGAGEIFSACLSERYGKSVRVRAIEEGFLPHDSRAALLKRTGLDRASLEEFFQKVRLSRKGPSF